MRLKRDNNYLANPVTNLRAQNNHKKSKNTISKKIIYFIAILIISLFLIEMFLRVAGIIYIDRSFSEQTKKFRNNNATVILTLGESSTAGLGVTFSQSYPGQLEAMLRKHYPNKSINVVVPIHVGQNTGQLSNRIKQHIKLYKPKILIIMAGYNNEWSLAESNIGKYVSGNEGLMIRIMSFLDEFRTFRTLRYIFLYLTEKKDTGYISRLEGNHYVWGGPELARYPPKAWIYNFANDHNEEFRKLWHDDIQNIISIAKKEGVEVILMTYHINPTYLQESDFLNISENEDVILVRNDLTFDKIKNNDSLGDYLQVDHWHPNQKGYAIIARNAFDAIVNNSLIEK